MAYNYILTLDYDNKLVEIKSNDIFAIMQELEKPVTTKKVTVVNGFTGEVLLHSNEEKEPYSTHEFYLMCLGWAMLTEWNKEE